MGEFWNARPYSRFHGWIRYMFLWGNTVSWAGVLQLIEELIRFPERKRSPEMRQYITSMVQFLGWNNTGCLGGTILNLYSTTSRSSKKNLSKVQLRHSKCLWILSKTLLLSKPIVITEKYWKREQSFSSFSHSLLQRLPRKTTASARKVQVSRGYIDSFNENTDKYHIWR